MVFGPKENVTESKHKATKLRETFVLFDHFGEFLKYIKNILYV